MQWLSDVIRSVSALRVQMGKQWYLSRKGRTFGVSLDSQGGGWMCYFTKCGAISKT